MKRASAHVGRVGGLAVALGIGAAVVTGGAATAWAVPDGSQDSAGSADASSPAGSTASARADSTRTADRSRWNRRAAPAAAGARDAGLPERTADPNPQANAAPSAVAIPNPVTTPPALRAAPRLQAARVHLSAPVPSAKAAVAPAAASALRADQRAAEPSVVTPSVMAPIVVAPTAAAPVMVAAPQTAAVNSIPAPLLGSGPTSPVQTPVSWSALAVARRQFDVSNNIVPQAVTPSTGLIAPTMLPTEIVLPAPTVLPAATATNSPPVISAVTLSTPNATTGAITGTVRATDANGDRLTYRATATTKGAVTITSTGVFVYVPTPAARHAAARVGAPTTVTTDTVTVTVTDAKGAVTTRAVAVMIAPTNTAPVPRVTVGTPNAATGVVTGSVSATDADRDRLTYSTPATTTKGSVSLNAGTGAFTYTPAESSRAVAGTDTFTVTVTDGHGGATPMAVSVPIAAKVLAAEVTFVFNYGTGSQLWSQTAKNSLQAAGNTVASYFVAKTPVTIVFNVSAENSPTSATLASAGSDLISTRAGFYATVVQHKIQTGVDSNGPAADGEIEVNLGMPWAFGDSVSSSQYDFTATAIHEIMHTLGFLSYVEAPGSSWNTRGTNWTKFDSFIVTNKKTRVIGTNFRWNAANNPLLTGGGGGLYFGGPNAIAIYGGPVPLYTPNPWEPGSSVAHTDDATFTGVKTLLMNALADTGKGIRTLSAVELAIFKDLGYTVVPVPASATALLFIGFVLLRRRKP